MFIILFYLPLSNLYFTSTKYVYFIWIFYTDTDTDTENSLFRHN